MDPSVDDIDIIPALPPIHNDGEEGGIEHGNSEISEVKAKSNEDGYNVKAAKENSTEQDTEQSNTNGIEAKATPLEDDQDEKMEGQNDTDPDEKMLDSAETITDDIGAEEKGRRESTNEEKKENDPPKAKKVAWKGVKGKGKQPSNVKETQQSRSEPSSDPDSTWMSPSQRHKIVFRYYAVRVGYARASYFREDTDGIEVQKRLNHTGRTAPMVKIRSAIFLYWDDVCQFVETIQNMDANSSLEFKVEYGGFDSITEAEAYLLEPETRLAFKHVESFGLRLPAADRRTIITHSQIAPPASYRGLRHPPVPHLYMPFPSHWLSVPNYMITAPSTHTQSKQKRIVKKLPVKKAQSTKRKLTSARKKKSYQQQMKQKMTAKEIEEENNAKREKHWQKMFQKLMQYKEQNDGSIEIPEPAKKLPGSKKTKGAKGKKGANESREEREQEHLRNWCDRQKQRHRAWVCGYTSTTSGFSQEKYDKLKDAGFDFPEVLTWEQQYEKLKAYKEEHNTLKVEEEHDEELSKWTAKQRMALGKHFEGKPVKLTEEKLKKLMDLGWKKAPAKMKAANGVLDPHDEEKKWDEKYHQLIEYVERNGNMVFPNSVSGEDAKLRHWVTMLRREYQKLQNGRETTLTAIQMKRLGDIGFDFNPRGVVAKSNDVRWEQHLQDLREYKEEYGDFTLNKKANIRLSQLIMKLRQKYRARQRGEHNTLSDERIAQLEEIGFDFVRGKSPQHREVRRSWEERFEQLLQFKEVHGHTVVPQIAGGVLGEWVRRQRMEYKALLAGEKSSLTHEKALRLSSIGFCFDASSRFKGKRNTAKAD